MDLKYTDVMKPENINIAQLWTVFAGMVLAPNAPQLQRDEMRMSFYAGFTEAFKITTDLATELSEEQAVKVLSVLSLEAQEFYESMKARIGAVPSSKR